MQNSRLRRRYFLVALGVHFCKERALGGVDLGDFGDHFRQQIRKRVTQSMQKLSKIKGAAQMHFLDGLGRQTAQNAP